MALSLPKNFCTHAYVKYFGHIIHHAINYSDTAPSAFTLSFGDLQEAPSELLLKEYVASIFRVEVSVVELKCQELSSAHKQSLCGQFHFCSVASSLREADLPHVKCHGHL
jgi:hypothetical protein